MCTHLLPTAIILLPSLAQVPHLNAPASRHTPPLQLCICLSQSRSLSLQCSFQLTSAEAVLDRSKAYVGVCVTCVYIYIYTRVYIYICHCAVAHTAAFPQGVARVCHVLPPAAYSADGQRGITHDSSLPIQVREVSCATYRSYSPFFSWKMGLHNLAPSLTLLPQRTYGGGFKLLNNSISNSRPSSPRIFPP